MILEDVLAAAAVDYNVSSSNRYEVTFNCPFCEDRGFPQDSSYHFGLNILKGLGHCFRCGWKLRGVLPITKELSEVYGVKVALTGREEQKKETKQVPEELEAIGLPDGYERFSTKPDIIELKARSYLKKRNVSQLQIAKHRIGYAATGNMAWRIVFPVIGTDTKVYGWVARSFTGAKPKYLNSTGIKGLWNANREVKTAVIAEGIMSALSVEQALFRVRDSVAIARLGSTVTALQLSLLTRYENIIVFPDHDVAGIKGAIELANKCNDKGMNVGLVIPEAITGRDPGDMQADEILVYLRGAKTYNKDVVNRLRAIASKHAF